MYKLEPALAGDWPFDDLPDTIEIDGVVFERAIRKQPYEGVIEQYRQAVPRDSLHMFVKEDGTFVADHVDEYNPDMGHPVRHFIVDHPIGRLGVLVAPGAIMLAIAVKRGMLDEKEQSNGSTGITKRYP